MVKNDLLVLMENYAVLGYTEWDETTHGRIRDQEKFRLKHNIVESEWQVRHQIQNIQSGKPTSFMPIRKHRHDGIKRCFFLPRRVGRESGLAFDLVLFITDDVELAFRFEPADDPDYSHNYPHIQFCRKVAEKQIDLDLVPPWIPDSYPAFPLPSSDPLRLFLAMLIAVYGRSGGVDDVIRETFQKVGRPADADQYIQLIVEMMNS